jgi:DNA repair protein RadC
MYNIRSLKEDIIKKIIAGGQQNLTTNELMSVLFLRKNNNVDMKNYLIEKTDINLKSIFGLSVNELINKYKICQKDAILITASFALSKRAYKEDMSQDLHIKTPYDALNYLIDIRHKRKEHFVGLYLNARNQIIAKELISIGTLNASIVHPREVFEPAIRLNCASVIVAHNHPSGDTCPSEADIASTKQLYKAGEILGIDLIDHLVVSKNSFTSLKTNGYF